MSHPENLALTHVLLLVGDQDEARTFYTTIIGLEVSQDLPFSNGLRWLSVGAPGQPNMEVVLEVPEMAPDAAYTAAAHARLATGIGTTLIFQTRDIDATYARIAAAGATASQPITEQPYGRDCAFRDPWGNHIRFTQPHP